MKNQLAICSFKQSALVLPVVVILALGLSSMRASAQTRVYDAIGRLVWSTQPSGASTAHSYDANGNLLATSPVAAGTDTNGNGIPDSYEMLYTGSRTGMDATANPTKDGVCNLMKFALGLNPNLPDGVDLTTLSLVYSNGEGHMTLQYFRPKEGPLLLGYEVEVSTDLVAGSWSSAPEAVQELSAVDQGGGLELVTVQALAPVSSQPRMFMRLRVSKISQ